MMGTVQRLLVSVGGACLMGILLWQLSLLTSTPVSAAIQIDPLNGITEPTNDDVIAGVVLVEGTANHPEFLRYELSFYQEFNPYAGWIVFAEGTQPVISDTLAVWDTTVGRSINAPIFPDGAYQLRLRVVRRDYNYDEYFAVGFVVSNDSPTPTPTMTPTMTVDPNATITGTQTPRPDSDSIVAATALPTLTPFPTPSAPARPDTATAVAVSGEINQDGASVPANQTTVEDPLRGAVAQVSSINTEFLWTAAQIGGGVTVGIFALLAGYLLLRTIVYRVWVSRPRGRTDSRHKQ